MEATIWDVYFSSICSLRFHPRNDGNESAEAKVKHAAHIADLMLEERLCRGLSVEQCSEDL